MTKNEKEGFLYLRKQVFDLVNASDIDRKSLENYSLVELDFFNAQYYAYSNVLRLIDGLFFTECYGK